MGLRQPVAFDHLDLSGPLTTAFWAGVEASAGLNPTEYLARLKYLAVARKQQLEMKKQTAADRSQETTFEKPPEIGERTLKVEQEMRKTWQSGNASIIEALPHPDTLVKAEDAVKVEADRDVEVKSERDEKVVSEKEHEPEARFMKRTAPPDLPFRRSKRLRRE
ncbi:hypothetical protein CkaCkLH20_12233 [Colletotrichum karsti]|uniref:Uncharacterized protein n=1 Tax=Colletotrichum karsti TaxID=1095194 RepID=A0A9P6LCZ7_9PEZI|nr:uncharacterized protein CkaCkLH20_12233 [Colletotrichum karsti]KAF9870269.1 hypothetical protein CkaCkLH20_12233 [Colletotrichum karsti]